MFRDQAVNPECPMNGIVFAQDEFVQRRVVQESDPIITDDIPADKTMTEAADQAEATIARIDKQLSKQGGSSDLIPSFHSARHHITFRWALVRALNPETSAIATVALAARATGQAALTKRISLSERAVSTTRSGFAGAIAVGIAVSQPFNTLPGVRSGRHVAAKVARRLA